ncbi:MAG: MerR family transcriptional regulator [Alphaproteobacteria bacterium GM202ARS2]|nr:MerR family transcriptional regulator [Alphaproteobacteria bacterium GM202ARS2]
MTSPSSPHQTYTIGEVTRLLNLPAHVLRFWEQHFIHLNPRKKANGQRAYNETHVALLKIIKRLLHQEGYTIKGAQRLLNSKTLPDSDSLHALTVPPANTHLRETLERVLHELQRAEQWLTAPPDSQSSS